jgi:HAD superfamily hydrolase (TIGR01490 family)
MSLAIFDLDNTLLAGDSDYLWGCFLAERGVVDREWYEQENRRYYEDYKQGQLDIFEFLEFALAPLTLVESTKLFAWRKQYVETVVTPLVANGTLDLLSWHRKRGDTLLIITATNSFITRPIAELLDVEHLLATDPETVAGRFTGRVAGTPCFRDGKVERLRSWLAETNQTLVDSFFYSDSHNDIPLLEIVDHPIAVDPDANLAATAKARNWPMISLRQSFTEGHPLTETACW